MKLQLSKTLARIRNYFGKMVQKNFLKLLAKSSVTNMTQILKINFCQSSCTYKLKTNLLLSTMPSPICYQNQHPLPKILKSSSLMVVVEPPFLARVMTGCALNYFNFSGSAFDRGLYLLNQINLKSETFFLKTNWMHLFHIYKISDMMMM